MLLFMPKHTSNQRTIRQEKWKLISILKIGTICTDLKIGMMGSSISRLYFTNLIFFLDFTLTYKIY